MNIASSVQHRLQQGSALLIAVVLLLLASLMALLAMNVGIFEQRSSGNDLRAKVVHQVAEAGLAQGFEFLFRANPAMLDTTANWQVCAASDTSFPCGAVDASVRGNMFRLVANAGGYTDTGANALPVQLTRHMVRNSSVLPAMGGFDVAYGVAPVLCRVPLQTTVSTTEVPCSTSTDMSTLSERRVVTFVSVAQIRGDAGRTTLTQTVARSSLLAQNGGQPTIIASGNVVPPGNGDVVAMPDSAGPGLDLSVWSRLNVEPASGSFATCTRQDFLASGEQNLLDADWVSDRTCDKCGCGMAKKLPGYTEGWDILDKDSNDPSGINKDVVPAEFPCDLFEYTFNIKAWTDTDADEFCETRMAKVKFKAPDGTEVMLYPDEAFLYQYAGKIKPTSANAYLVKPDQLQTGDLSSSSSGLIWCQVDCMPNNGNVGTVQLPVAVIADPGTNTPYHSKLFGLLFYRANGDGPLDATTGGNAAMKFNAQSAVYGSMVIMGQVTTGSGGGLIFGDRDILRNLVNNPDLTPRFDTLRGGWSDRASY